MLRLRTFAGMIVAIIFFLMTLAVARGDGPGTQTGTLGVVGEVTNSEGIIRKENVPTQGHQLVEIQLKLSSALHCPSQSVWQIPVIVTIPTWGLLNDPDFARVVFEAGKRFALQHCTSRTRNAQIVIQVAHDDTRNFDAVGEYSAADNFHALVRFWNVVPEKLREMQKAQQAAQQRAVQEK